MDDLAGVAVLAFAALTLPRQPYTGLMLRGDWVARVEPGSPGEAAGIRPATGCCAIRR